MNAALLVAAALRNAQRLGQQRGEPEVHYIVMSETIANIMADLLEKYSRQVEEKLDEQSKGANKDVTE